MPRNPRERSGSGGDALQAQLDEFREHYNQRRPHRALQRRTPGEVYHATPKAVPATNGRAPGHYRLRYDRLDTKGRMTLRRAGRMHHLGIGTAHARKRVLAFADDLTCSLAALTVQAAGVWWVSPPSFQVAATSRGVR